MLILMQARESRVTERAGRRLRRRALALGVSRLSTLETHVDRCHTTARDTRVRVRQLQFQDAGEGVV